MKLKTLKDMIWDEKRWTEDVNKRLNCLETGEKAPRLECIEISEVREEARKYLREFKKEYDEILDKVKKRIVKVHKMGFMGRDEETDKLDMRGLVLHGKIEFIKHFFNLEEK